MRRFVIDSFGAAATGEEPHAWGVEWPDGLVTIRMRCHPHDLPSHFRNMAGLVETCNAQPRWLDPSGADAEQALADCRDAIERVRREGVPRTVLKFEGVRAYSEEVKRKEPNE